MNYRRWLLILLGTLLLLRLAFIGRMELTPDEAYYFMWSERPDISYYSKGPGIAMTIWLGTHLFGATEFGVRFFSPLLALGTSLLMWSLTRRLYGEAIAFWAVLTLQVIPIFQVGGLLMTIDPLSLFFWVAALVTAWRALEHEPGFNGWWPATGAVIGAGFLCKWVNAFQLLSLLLLLATTRKHRPELRRGGFWSMLGVFALFLTPPLWWNYRHAWITVDHLTARGGLKKAMGISAGEFFEFLGVHFGVYSPLVFAGVLVALWWGGQRALHQYKPRFLTFFALPVLALYFLLSLRQAGEANWTAPAILTLFPLAVAYWYERAQKEQWVRRVAVVALGLALACGFVFLDVDLARAVGIPWPYPRDPGARVRGWKSFAAAVSQVREQYEKETHHPVFLIGNSYQTAALLNFYLQPHRVEAPGHPVAYYPESKAFENQFSFWERYDGATTLEGLAQDFLKQPPAGDPAARTAVTQALATVTKLTPQTESYLRADARRQLARALHTVLPELPIDDEFVEEGGIDLFTGRTALYVTDREEDRPASSVEDGFDHWELIATLDLQRRGLPLRQLRVFACQGYHGREP